MPNSIAQNRLYELLPAIYRWRDEQSGSQLRALLDVIAGQVDLVEQDIARLYENWFIETAEDWVVPYIADLLGVEALHPITGDEGFSLRAYVANILAYRRRKGTAYVLEDLARAVSGWPARSVEFFQRVQVTQNLNHRSRSRTSVDLRDLDAVDLLNGPFDSLAHSVDVRPPTHSGGWHAIKRVGLFLWRLKAYPLNAITARRSGEHPYGFSFNPLGAPAPLFNQPAAQGDLARLAAETDIPGAIRPLAFALDLSHYRQDQAPRQPSRRPENTAYYGPDASLNVAVQGQPLPPMDVVAWNLAEWDRPPAGVEGLFSGDLSAFPALPTPTQVEVTIGGVGPVTLTLAGPPASLVACRTALEKALRSASAAREFAGARVLSDGNRLLVLPGRVGASIQFNPSAADPSSAAALKLDAAGSGLARGALSADMGWLPGPANPNPRFMVRIGAAGPHLVTLSAAPVSPADARGRLESALQLAGPEAEFTAARVLLVDHRLLVLPGVDGARVVFQAAPADRVSVEQFGLADKTGIDVSLGRISFPLGNEPTGAQDVQVSYSYGFSADLGGGPYLRRRSEEEERPEAAVIVVKKGSPTDTLAKALQDWSDGGKKVAVIEVQDNGPYEESLVIDLPASGWLRIHAAPQLFPHLRFPAALQVNAPAQGAALVLEGLLVEGGVQLSGGVNLTLRHVTLVPGQALNEDGSPAFPDRPSITATGAALAGLRVTLERCICGPLILPADCEQIRVADSILHAPLAADGSIQAALAGSLNGSQPGPPLVMERVTVFGKVLARQIELASEVIFNHAVKAERKQIGCVRFSYLPHGQSQVPAPYHCQPEQALVDFAREKKLNSPSAIPVEDRQRILARVQPEYSAERYPHPAYAQLALSCPPEIRSGGEQGSEMGAFNRLQQPQREANLRSALPDFLPFGMDLAYLFET